MTQKLTTISLPMPMRMGNVNCYLLHTEVGYFLIDTGSSSARKKLIDKFIAAGCIPLPLNQRSESVLPVTNFFQLHQVPWSFKGFNDSLQF